jgi:hypothetical protein
MKNTYIFYQVHIVVEILMHISDISYFKNSAIFILIQNINRRLYLSTQRVVVT